MRLRSYSVPAGIAALTLLAACSSSTPTADLGDLASMSATIEITANGGIAALHTADRIDYASHEFVHVQRHICNDLCDGVAPLDSARGTVAAARADSLFNAVLAKKNSFKDDYGTTQNAADMMLYTVRITSDGSTKTIRADDGTMPDALRQIVSAVRAAIDAARK